MFTVVYSLQRLREARPPKRPVRKRYDEQEAYQPHYWKLDKAAHGKYKSQTEECPPEPDPQTPHGRQ